MKLVVLAIGRMKPGPERDLFHRYVERAEAAARSVGLGGMHFLEIDESRARSAEQRKREEAAALLARVPAGATLILLHEGAPSQPSEAFARMIGDARDGGAVGLTFAIGGPDGFDPTLLTRNRTLGFGAATFPHQLVRVLLAEQIYRATTILAGHPYHRV